MARVAVVQAPPVLLDRERTLARAAEHIRQAGADGARLVVFSESYVPGYPDWLWRLRPYNDHALTHEIHARLMANAITLGGGELAPVQEAARAAGATVLLGIHERDGQYSRATLYNTLVAIGDDGAIKNRHRKLVPTNPERLVWGQGDGAGLRVLETPIGRVGGLICWENYMPLARFTLYADGVEIYVAATWDYGAVWRASMQHIAKEGRCWVVSVCPALQAKDVPDDFPGKAQLYPDPEEWLNPGESMIVDPMGRVTHGPLEREKSVLVADLDVGKVAAAHRTLDTAGHYGRPDVFKLEVNRTPAAPVKFKDG